MDIVKIKKLKNDFNLGTFMAKRSSFSVDANHDLLQVINVIPKNLIMKRY